MAIDSQQLMTMLDTLGIATTTVEHPPLRTIEDSRRLRGHLPGGHAKNLFLKDKKGGYWLLVALEHTAVDLREAASLLQAPRFSFANAEALDRLLGVQPGAVSPFAAVNDVEGQVCVVLEQQVLDTERLNCHPLRNDRTTTIATTELLRFLDQIGHPPRIIRLPG
ncbi:MAG TPA: prolyl-tRNA synthetase associated domain-containing protein [Candidatus Competibacteraceae bacterium]|nr:MAG: prolyl-tRNA synthetase associated domain-containing protein [Candidatus Competibacteraceae bacterium]HOB61867.1 prolyl-tRNA synthetase associated domain-containing protein [Candidatus Competibacteraceae bacterium]HQA25431.1 prolyl-tRNA synthetase associated domain-containing protein [Candidatus Competibacteraceae bacterium]HQD56101.1 prolyl-tRNA synthetase associated domain-containing protein [Candidatus Competibacteraceae bacterium]